MRILAVAATEAESAAFCRPWPAAANVAVGPYPARVADTDGGELVVLTGGIGPVAAAVASTAGLVSAGRFDLAVSTGVAGVFPRAPVGVGGVVVADLVVDADLEVRTRSGARPLPGARGRYPVSPQLAEALADRVRAAGLAVAVGPVLTVTTVTGTDERAAELAARHRALAEAMEGAGVAAAADRFGVPVAEMRVGCNLVGARQRERWRLADALQTLSVAARAAFTSPLDGPVSAGRVGGGRSDPGRRG